MLKNQWSSASSFLESVFEDFAYEDRAFPIAVNQNHFASFYCCRTNRIVRSSGKRKKFWKLVQVGYQTAVLVNHECFCLHRRRQKIYTILKKKITWNASSSEISKFGDGFLGLPTFAPFDKILVTCGAEILPIELLKQLKIGGKMVIPMGKTDEQILYRFTKISEKNLKRRIQAYKFVPMLQDRNK